jgi:hypothetical protein
MILLFNCLPTTPQLIKTSATTSLADLFQSVVVLWCAWLFGHKGTICLTCLSHQSAPAFGIAWVHGVVKNQF